MKKTRPEGDGYERTSDLHFAAYLITVGVELKKTERDGRRIVFVFDPLERGENYAELEMGWFGRTAKVVAANYADNIRNLKTLCHQQGPRS